MPRDHWRKARDREVARRAGREFAAEGRSTYPTVWGDDPLPPPAGTAPDPGHGPGPKKAIWLVLDGRGVAVDRFEYCDRPRAEARAAELSRSSGTPHRVGPGRVPFRPAARPAPTVSPAGKGRPAAPRPVPKPETVSTPVPTPGSPPTTVPGDGPLPVTPSLFSRLVATLVRFLRGR